MLLQDTYRSLCRSVVEGNVENDNVRYISGNVLTGTRISRDGFPGFYDSQITVIPEGNNFEFLAGPSREQKTYFFQSLHLSFPAKESLYTGY
jgi:Na+-transporting NADH:ubiquinone oxidoreductase subunit A